MFFKKENKDCDQNYRVGHDAHKVPDEHIEDGKEDHIDRERDLQCPLVVLKAEDCQSVFQVSDHRQ